MIKYFLHRCGFREDWSKVLRQEAKPCFWTAGLNEQSLHLFLNYSLQFPLSFWGSCISSLQHTLHALSPSLPHKQHATSVTCPPTHESSAGLMQVMVCLRKSWLRKACAKPLGVRTQTPSLLQVHSLKCSILKIIKFVFSPPNNIYSLISIMTK